MDAVAVAGLAGSLDAPVLLTAADTLPDATAGFVRDERIREVVIVGGTSSVSDDVKNALTTAGAESVKRVDACGCGSRGVHSRCRVRRHANRGGAGLLHHLAVVACEPCSGAECRRQRGPLQLWHCSPPSRRCREWRGIFLGGLKLTRVAVFIDYENTRFGARDVFGDPTRDPYTFGHVLPLRLGLVLKQLGESVDPSRELTAVMVYRGRPGPKGGPRAQAGSARQFAAWEGQPLVTVRSRPLRYQPIEWSMGKPVRWRAEEKGIDVMMALDIALGARDDLYDVAVVTSADSDLVPAIEVALAAGKRVETAMWWSPTHRHRRLRIPGRRLWNHALDAHRFAQVRDDTDYAVTP